jgi:hypothetical protein
MSFNYKKLCTEFIKDAKQCTANQYKHLLPRLEELGFFKKIQAIKTYKELVGADWSIHSVFQKDLDQKKINLDECVAPAISSQGRIVHSMDYIDIDGNEQTHYAISGMPIKCFLIDIELKGEAYIDINQQNALIEVLNSAGANIKLLELPNYTDVELDVIFAQ